MASEANNNDLTTFSVVNEKAISSATIEQDNEIVALDKDPSTKKWTLSLGHAYSKHWQKATANSDISKMNDVFVISLLGNTTAGKSFLTKHLLNSAEDGPQIVDESEIQSSTTGNINCYQTNVPNNSVKKLLLLDYEGEKGSSFPLMLQARRLFAERVGLTSEYAKERRKAVTEYFPKLAYVLSNVVILLGKEELISADYLNRCYEFTMSANMNISDIPHLPVLIVIENQCSLAKKFNIEDVTKEFFQIHNRETDDLKKYFSKIYCVRLPHTDTTQRVRGVKIDGEVVFHEQLTAIRNLVANIILEQQERLITYAQWLFLLEQVLDSVSKGKPVSIHSLLSTISDSSDDMEQDIALKFFKSKYFQERLHTPEIYQGCRDLAMRVFSRNIAIKLLRQENLLSERMIRDTCKVKMPEMWTTLDNFKPCEAIYTGPGDSESGNPVYCYQSKGSHSQHRTSEGIKDLTWWSRLFGWTSTAVWPGTFISSDNGILCEENLEKYSSLTIKLINIFRENELQKYLHFISSLEEANFEGLPLLSRRGFCDCCLKEQVPEKDPRLLWIIHVQSVVRGSCLRVCRHCKEHLLEIKVIEKGMLPKNTTYASTEEVFTASNTVDAEDCVICMAAKKDYAFTPCGHKGFCSECAERVFESSKLCPICKSHVDSILRVHDV